MAKVIIESILLIALVIILIMLALKMKPKLSANVDGFDRANLYRLYGTAFIAAAIALYLLLSLYTDLHELGK